MSQPSVQFDEVSYVLPNGTAILRNIRLSVAPGTTTALLGRSGSGKTTLLRTVNGLVRPTSGTGGQRGHNGGQHGRAGADSPAACDGLRHPGDWPVSSHDSCAQRRACARTCGKSGTFPRLHGSRSVYVLLALMLKNLLAGTPGNSPAGNGSGLDWPARLRLTRPCSYSTSHLARWIQSPVPNFRPLSAICSHASTKRPCW